MARVETELDDDLLAEAGQILGTSLHEETVESALREIIAVRRRVEALARLRAMVADGAVDVEFLLNKENYRPKPPVRDSPQDLGAPSENAHGTD